VVDAHDEHRGGVLGGSGHYDLLGTADEVLGGTSVIKKFAGRLNDVLGAERSPLNSGGVLLVCDSDGLSVDNKLAAVDSDSAGVLAVYRVILYLKSHERH
jgi:hypothetical protein